MSEAMNRQRAKRVASLLLGIEAVFLRPEKPFVWASGIKSPVYCDNRLILTEPEARGEIEAGLADLVRECFPEVEVLMGTSTAGIPHAAFVAEKLGLPMGYVRGAAKDHGRENRIEGRLRKGQKVAVIEDLVSTGGSVLEVVRTLEEAGAEVLGIAAIFSYGMKKAQERMTAAGTRLATLSDFDAIVETAAEEGRIRTEDVERLLRFRDCPQDESWIRN